MWKGQVELLKGMDELTTFTLESTQVAGYGKHLVRVDGIEPSLKWRPENFILEQKLRDPSSA